MKYTSNHNRGKLGYIGPEADIAILITFNIMNEIRAEMKELPLWILLYIKQASIY